MNFKNGKVLTGLLLGLVFSSRTFAMPNGVEVKTWPLDSIPVYSTILAEPPVTVRINSEGEVVSEGFTGESVLISDQSGYLTRSGVQTQDYERECVDQYCFLKLQREPTFLKDTVAIR